MTWDVVIVGAGPAGALAARQLSLAGAAVLLLDRGDFPRWKVCGACLSPGALEVLGAVGLGGLPEELGGIQLHQLVLASGSSTARIDLAGSVSVSRSSLDRALVASAEEAGVRFWSGATALSTEDSDMVRRVTVRRDGADEVASARVVIDATGLGRRFGVSRSVTSGARAGSRVGLGAVYRDAASPVEPGDLHMIVGRSGYVGLVRLEDGRINVAAAADRERLLEAAPSDVVDGILAEAGRPPLQGTPDAGWRGTPALTTTSPSLGGRRLFRLGDAAGYVEPFTGEGMCWAFSGATALAPIVLKAVSGWRPNLLGSWEDYQRGRAERSKRLCRALAWGLRRPYLVRSVVTVLGVAPLLARPFVREAARAPSPVYARAPQHLPARAN